MLEWLARRMENTRIVYLIRHPCAVIGSQMRQEEDSWVAEMDEILCQPLLMKDFLEPFRKIISEARTALQRQTVCWCVQNFVAFTMARSNDWPVFCYEEFLFDRNQTFTRAFQSLGLEPTSVTENFRNLIVSNPTHDVKKSRPWHALLSEAEGNEVLRICDEFGLRLYGRQMMPTCTPKALIESSFVGQAPYALLSEHAVSSESTDFADPVL